MTPSVLAMAAARRLRARVTAALVVALAPIPIAAQQPEPAAAGAVRADSAPAAGAKAPPRMEVELRRPGTSEPGATFAEADVRALAAKLHDFGGRLSHGERLAMDWLLQRAAAAGEAASPVEVEGMLFTAPVVAAGAMESAGVETGKATEATLELNPAPAAALARALGLRLSGPAPGVEAREPSR